MSETNGNGNLRPIEPLRLRTIDGQERRFLLSMGGMKRLKVRLGVANLKEMLNQDVEACGIPILFEALLDKDPGMTEDSFAEMMPAHLDAMQNALIGLMNSSLPEPRPTIASETPTTLQ